MLVEYNILYKNSNHRGNVHVNKRIPYVIIEIFIIITWYSETAQELKIKTRGQKKTVRLTESSSDSIEHHLIILGYKNKVHNFSLKNLVDHL